MHCCSLRWPRPSARRGSRCCAAIFLFVRHAPRGLRRGAAPSGTSRVFAQPSSRCAGWRPGCFWVGIPMEAVRRRCSLRLSPGLLRRSCCSPIRCIRRSVRDELRTAHFPRLETPALFVSGARDGFGSVAEMEAALKLIPGRTELVTIAGAGHELATKKNRDAVAQRVVEAVPVFC